MTCNDYQEQVSQYIDRELGDAEAEGLFRHLSTCAKCRVFLRGSLELRSKIQDEILVSGSKQVKKTQMQMTKTRVLVLALLLIASTVGITKWAESTGEEQPAYFISLPAIEVQGDNPAEKISH